MASIRWFRCTDVHCDCRTTPPADMWSVVPRLEELAMTAMVSAVYRELGPAPGLGSADERALVEALTGRLRHELQGDLVQACPWLLGREVLAGWRVLRLPPPATLPNPIPVARAA